MSYNLIQQLQDTQIASRSLLDLDNDARSNLVTKIADAIWNERDILLIENQNDLNKMDDDNPKKDRLLLNEERIAGMVTDAKNVAALPDPTGTVLLEREIEQGLQLQKISTPLGVVAIIYEARPNVTLDAISLCLKSGNAVVLRGGTDAEKSNIASVSVVHEVLKQEGLSPDLVHLMPVDREYVQPMLEAERYIDVVIPRGSANLINFVRKHSKIPTIETGAGVCHTYVHEDADLAKSATVVVNAKVSRPSVCNCLDTLIVDREIAGDFLPLILDGMAEHEVKIHADSEAFPIIAMCEYPYLFEASDEDFGREYLDYACSVKVVDGFDPALDHIALYSSRHSEAICTDNKDVAESFLKKVDAAAVYHNASTRFTDGGVFQLGAEIGISTQKLHARGPFALEKLVTEKWIVRGEGQIRI